MRRKNWKLVSPMFLISKTPIAMPQHASPSTNWKPNSSCSMTVFNTVDYNEI
jgi:hypothetical protein